MDRRRLEQIEQYVLDFFQRTGRARIVAQELFDSTAEFANADIVRALEDLEESQRLLTRHTTEGNDYISLTPQGAAYLDLDQTDLNEGSALPHPPKSATRNN